MGRDLFLGVDPGASGAIGVVDGRGEYVDHIRLQETDRDVYLWLSEYKDRVAHGLLEAVHSMPLQGVSSSFKFGVSYGFCNGILIASEIAFERVTPQKWMKRMRCMTGGDKNVTKTLAQQLWTTVKVTHANADALLIAECCRRTVLGVGSV